MIRVVCLLIGYVFGLFQTSFLYGKMHGIDIRNYGSGNAGTTNALRVLGTKAGLIVFGGDVIKCILAVLVVRLLFGNSHPDMKYLYMLYAGAGAIFLFILISKEERELQQQPALSFLSILILYR